VGGKESEIESRGRIGEKRGSWAEQGKKNPTNGGVGKEKEVEHRNYNIKPIIHSAGD